MKNIIIILICSFCNIYVYSQQKSVKNLKDWELVGFAESAERINDKHSAINFYTEYYIRNKQDNKIANKLANLYFETKEYKKAQTIFYNLYKADDKKYSKALFKYAQILKNEGKYDSAISCFEIYRDNFLHKEKKENRNLYYLMIKHEIEGCENISSNKLDNICITPLNKTINKAHEELSPLLINDSSFVYSSMNIDSIPIINIEQEKNIPVTKFYSAKLKDGVWKGGFLAPLPFFNYDSLCSTSGVFSDDNKRFYFTLSKENIKGKRISSIYVSEYKNNEWQKPVKLDKRINLKGYMSAQPAIGKCYNINYDVVYFVSDRPGGVGGKDIWYTIYDRQTKKYKKPVNAGSYINTPGNEITPYCINSSKTIFYSSDALAGFGGYDIYKTIGELLNWLPPTNLGEPINSPFDDVYYTGLENNKKGFIVSNRTNPYNSTLNHCCYDIFQYEIIKNQKIKVLGKISKTDTDFIEIFKNGSIINKVKQTEKEIPTIAKVELHIENKNNNEYILLKTDSTSQNGDYSFNVDKDQNYMIKITKDNFISTKFKFNTYNKKNVLASVTIIPLQKEPIYLRNIYFEFNKAKLTGDSKAYIDTSLLILMKEYGNIVIEINAHTDGIGSSEYNLKLSGDRADSVEKYLVNHGIKRERIISKGFGEAKPITEEFDSLGNDYPEGRGKNRRTEFRVVGLLIDE